MLNIYSLDQFATANIKSGMLGGIIDGKNHVGQTNAVKSPQKTLEAVVVLCEWDVYQTKKTFVLSLTSPDNNQTTLKTQ